MPDDSIQLVRETLSLPPSERKLSPIQVGQQVQILCATHELVAIAEKVGLRDLGTLRQFLRVLALPKDVLGRIVWGRQTGQVSFSVAAEITRAKSVEDQRALINAAAESSWSKQDIQKLLRKARSEQMPIQTLIDETASR